MAAARPWARREYRIMIWSRKLTVPRSATLNSMAYDFDMTVIGGGAAGLTAVGISASLGASTALVEARRLGGDCTWHGCIPSKTLLKAAGGGVPFARAIERVHSIRQQVYEDADAPPNLQRLGVEVLCGTARFVDPHTVEWSESGGAHRRISSRYFVVAAGSVPAIPPIDGIERASYLTNESLFELRELPRRLIVLGAGPIGIEMAHAFRRFGSEVVVVGSSRRVLPRDDEELARILQEQLAREGIRFALGTRANRVESGSTIRLHAGGKAVEGDVLLVAAGRRSPAEPLNLAAAGVVTGKEGVTVDKHCRTSARHIYASGDITGRYRFTHMAEHMSKVAVTNALLHLPVSIDEAGLTWCTFTDPELAHVGKNEEQLRRSGINFGAYRFPLSKLDRAITDDATAGMIKVLARPFDGRIYGAGILAPRAGDMIAEYALAIRHGITLRQIADTIHPYPTYALGNRRAADQWYVRKQSATLVRWLQKIFGYRGQLPDTSDRERIV